MVSLSITLILCSCLVFVATAEQITPIWISPLNATSAEPEFQSVREQWTNISIGVAARSGAFSIEVDSQGMVWIMGGSSAEYYMNAVWNYDPKTDLYRWVAGSVNDSYNDFSVITDYGVPSKDGFPGYMSFMGSAIDYNDNIWIYGGEGVGNMFWRFNTSSFEFTNFRYNDTELPLISAVGVPAADNYPGEVDGGALLVDSNNNLWLMGGYSRVEDTGINTVWHFNTTSLMWTFFGGDPVNSAQINFANQTWNGRWSAGAVIDSDDRIWIFGGWGDDPTRSNSDAWGDMWSFDTKTLTWRVEWGNESSFLTNSSVAVPDDFDINNYPRARTTPVMVDRQDGTLLIGSGLFYASATPLNDFWLFNKTSKMWKHVYGSLGDDLVPNQYTNYRAEGSVFGSRRYSGRSGGVHNRGNLILCGGDDRFNYYFSDIWVIPQGQCVGANNDCDVNAECTSATTLTMDFFSHTCTCKEGYIGDGKTCTLPPPPMPVGSSPQPSKTSGAATMASSIFVFLSVALLA